MERRLAALLATDAVGYSKLTGLDEEAALAALAERRSIIDQLIESHDGRIFGTADDSDRLRHQARELTTRAERLASADV